MEKGSDILFHAHGIKGGISIFETIIEIIHRNKSIFIRVFFFFF